MYETLSDFWVVFTGTVIFAEPLKLIPFIFLEFCNVVAVVAFPESAPANVVVVNVFVLGLYVNSAALSV